MEFSQYFPKPGWVEHDAMEIWDSQLAVARQVIRECNISASDIASIGIANQRETTVLWDRKSGQPISPAIVWQDRRTADICERLEQEGKTALFRQKTGLVLDAYFSGTKIQWMLDNVPGARARADRSELYFGTIDSWLLYNLCGEHLTDASNASRTLLFNIHTLTWDDELLACLNVPRSLLPRVVASSGLTGLTFPALLGAAIPICGIAGDQQAATFGQACVTPGMAKNTFGTGCFMLMNTGCEPVDSKNNLVTTVGWSITPDLQKSTQYMLEGSVFIGGAVVQWLRDGLGIIQSASEVEALAASVPDTGGVSFVPAFSGLGAPYWDPHARGLLIGMSRGTTKAHIARAALASIAYQVADLLHAMKSDAGIALNEMRVDGGACKNDLLMQFQADILGVPVLRPVVTETTALGAAYLAGLAVGFWESTEEIASKWRIDRRFEPTMSDLEREQRLLEWHRAVERSRRWAE
jgi:glycerol kinase